MGARWLGIWALCATGVAGLRLTAPPMGRRALLGKVAAGSAALALPLSPALANTAAELAEPMAQFNDGEAKRAAFMVKMKAYKKSWRKELANLEYSTSDAEAKEAVVALIKLIRVNGNEIPEGVRKQDLDQVYKRVKDNLGKDTRMAYLQLDTIVRDIVTVKSLKGFGEELPIP